MDLHRTKEGFALYKEKTQIGFCTLTPAPKGAAIAALCIQPQWRRKGYGSYFLKEILRSFIQNLQSMAFKFKSFNFILQIVTSQ